MKSTHFYIALVILLVLPTEALDERCDYCVAVVNSIHAWFSWRHPSRRQIFRKSVRTCRRYPKYKSRCMRVVYRNTDVFVDEVTKMPFDVLAACKNLKECRLAETLESFEELNEID